jgi:hypothetical protein
MEQEGPPSDRRAFSKETWILFDLIATAITTTVIIGESAVRSGVPATEPFAIVAAAKAEAGIAERIEPAMLKGIFSAPHQPVAETVALFKSHPTLVLPIIPTVVFAVIAISAIVLPVAAITVAPSPILSEGAGAAGGDQERCGQSD